MTRAIVITALVILGGFFMAAAALAIATDTAPDWDEE
jgi:hypothetical protein